MTSRRQFLNQTSASALGGSALTSTLLNLTNSAAGNIISPSLTDSKSLVCLFFRGGMDTYNLLIPRDSTRYSHYSNARSNLAISLSDLNQLDPDPVTGERYGIHPFAAPLADMFNGNGQFSTGSRLSFIGNLGTLIHPLTLSEFNSPGPNTSIPRALASHFDQLRQWQTSRPGATSASANLTGWAGRLSELFKDCTPGNEILNISFAGNNILQRGATSAAFALSQSGLSGSGLSGPTVDISNPSIQPGSAQILKNSLHQRIINETFPHYLEGSYAQISSQSIVDQLAIKSSGDFFDSSDETIVGMPNTTIGNKLRDVLKIIYARKNNAGSGLRRQTFFVDSENWDMHADLEEFEDKIDDVSKSIAAFQNNLRLLGLEDGVIGFTASDFARTLRSNGQGSDHAWGGPQFVFGAPIQSGHVFGRFADLSPGSNDDIGRGGRMIPYHSTDEYYAELVKWFGVTDTNALNTILPNYQNFVGVSGRQELNFLAPA